MPQATIVCQVISVLSGSTPNFTDTRLEISGDLFTQIDGLISFMNRILLPVSLRTGEGKRIDDLEIPKIALREIIANALIHRDYNTQQHVSVRVTDSFIEISNPGEFPQPFDSATLWNKPFSKPRDAMLSRLAYHAGYVERIGSGLAIVKETFTTRELKLPEISSANGHTIVKIFRPSKSAIEEFDFRKHKQRYLDYIIATHQNSPVAGFETNLRVPIPLEKVYITLQARMAELDHARDGRRKLIADLREFQSNRTVTVHEALQFALAKKYDGMVILGQPGSGKTTLAKHFLLCFATDKSEKNLQLSQKLLPILLFLRDVDPQKPFIENILSTLQKHQLGLDEKFFLPYLQKGESILLLDGLDEVPTEEKREQVSQWIHQQVHLAFPRCPVIVTSRFSGYRGGAVLPSHYLRLEIQDYTLEQVKQFLENWLTAVETHVHEDNRHWRNEAKQKAEDLYRHIEQTVALRDLAVNPLMLQIIALVHRDRGTLPKFRIELYKECTDVLLERWDKAKGLNVLLSAAEARQLLQPVALWMHSVENRREVNRQELLDFMMSILTRLRHEVNTNDLLQSWQERSGIFKGEGDKYFFHHLSFQEYLTAEEIRNSRKIEILVKNFDKAWWHEPTLLAMGLTNPSLFSDFMKSLLRAEWRDTARVDFMLRCIDETLVKDETPFAEALKRLKRTEARYHALLGLERIGTEKAKAAIRQVLHDKDEQIANQARTILEKLGEKLVK